MELAHELAYMSHDSKAGRELGSSNHRKSSRLLGARQTVASSVRDLVVMQLSLLGV